MILLFAAAVLSSVLQYPLPEALASSAQEWRKERRPEILHLFADQVFGATPSTKPDIHFRLTSTNEHALNGTAVRKQVTVFFSKDETGPQMHLLLYSPPKSHSRVPVFLGLNFSGNETVSADPGIDLPEVWIKGQKTKAEDKARGSSAQQWQVEKILSNGFALATIYCGDIEPDFDGGLQYGVRKLFPKPTDGQWGTLGAWAWGLSRAVDYLETDHAVDAKKVILIGHSRLGKASLWSAAQDPRYSVVISNESGVGGASLYRAATSETIEHLNTAFPHWFCVNFHQYTGHPDSTSDLRYCVSSLIPAARSQPIRSGPQRFCGALSISPFRRLLPSHRLVSKRSSAALARRNQSRCGAPLLWQRNRGANPGLERRHELLLAQSGAIAQFSLPAQHGG